MQRNQSARDPEIHNMVAAKRQNQTTSPVKRAVTQEEKNLNKIIKE